MLHDSADFIIKKLKWDTDFWGFGVLDIRGQLSEHATSMSDILINHDSRFAQYTCDAYEVDYARQAEILGFLHGDIRITLQRELTNNDLKFKQRDIHIATKCDIQTLKTIADGMYIDSRYSNDSHFNPDRVCDFYKEWVSNSVLGTFDDMCFCIAEDMVPVGFCTLKHTSYDAASIGLIGIDLDYQGRGLATKLLRGVCCNAFKQGCRVISVATQGRNVTAQRLYQRSGFTTSTVELIYHYWREM